MEKRVRASLVEPVHNRAPPARKLSVRKRKRPVPSPPSLFSQEVQVCVRAALPLPLDRPPLPISLVLSPLLPPAGGAGAEASPVGTAAGLIIGLLISRAQQGLCVGGEVRGGRWPLRGWPQGLRHRLVGRPKQGSISG